MASIQSVIVEQNETLEGTIERIIYANEENAWQVLALSVRGRGEVVVVGTLLGVQLGESLRLNGGWVKDAKWGKQFRVDSFEVILPATIIGMRRYLASGAIKGIGGKLAERLVHKFGLETLEVIDQSPEKLRQVSGIGAVLAQRICDSWQQQRDIRDLMLFLETHGIATTHAAKIQKRYGDQALSVLETEPHRLARDIFGIGFATADKIAGHIGIANEAPSRLAAGLLHLLRRAADSGHLYIERLDLLAEASRLLDVDQTTVDERLELLLQEGDVASVSLGLSSAIYLSYLERHESELARRLSAFTAQTELPLAIDVERAIAWFEEHSSIRLAAQQRQAVSLALTRNLLVITGGPGTGKTTLVRGITEIASRKKLQLRLAAPTGRAAKRLAQATDMEAMTVHRLLEFQPDSRTFARGPDLPLAADLLVLDEASMLDTSLANSLLRALSPRTRLILVGDVDQLPSIGPGRVLADLISSGVIEVVRLQEIFRQAEESLIVVNAHRVRDGLMPINGAETHDPKQQASDFFFIDRRQPEAILRTLKHLVHERIPGSFGFSPQEDIQVLTPMRRGMLGTANLNAELQSLLNPAGQAIQRGGQLLRVGDRIMQRRNNYDLGVFNGDIGRILTFDLAEQRASIDFESRIVIYPFSSLDELTLAYACSIHKSQGSEYTCVLIPLHTQHFALLQRNLLYTALTRGKQLVIVVGSRRALDIATHQQSSHRRRTLLAQRLRGDLEGNPRVYTLG